MTILPLAAPLPPSGIIEYVCYRYRKRLLGSGLVDLHASAAALYLHKRIIAPRWSSSRQAQPDVKGSMQTYLLLFVYRDTARTHVDKQEQTADNSYARQLVFCPYWIRIRLI